MWRLSRTREAWNEGTSSDRPPVHATARRRHRLGRDGRHHVPRAFEGQNKAAAPAQKIDEEYTKKIVDNTPDKRILTELVDHMPLPADPKVPSPLKFLGYVPGEHGKLTYNKDIVRYLEALDKASARVTMWSIGKTDEGRDMCALRRRRRGDDQAPRQVQADHRAAHRPAQDAPTRRRKQLIATGKPIYFATGSIHSPRPAAPRC